MPPLRDRREDIPALVRHFVDLFSRENNRRPQRFTPAALEFMQKARWKGNVRELRNTVERLLIMTPGDSIDVDDLRDVVRVDTRPAVLQPGVEGGNNHIAPGTLREFKEIGRAEVPRREAPRERVEHLQDGRSHRHAAQQPLQEARAVRDHPGE